MKKSDRVMLCDLTPCDYNPRLITGDQLRRLQASVREHTNTLAGWSAGDGFRLATTITVNRNGHRIVGGAQRVRALQTLGQDWIHRDDISWVDIVPGSASEKSLNLSLNNREAQGEFDGARLSDVLGDIQAEAPALYEGLELGLIDVPDVSPSTAADARHGRTEPDAVPEPATPADSRPGQVYRLGDHRLYCGDATKADTFDQLMAGEAVDLLLTDPPYGVAYESSGQATKPIANDDLDPAMLRRFLSAAFRAANAYLKPGASFYVWFADTMSIPFRMACGDAGWPIRQGLMWAKNVLVMGRQDYHWQHEPCLYGWKPGASHVWFGVGSAVGAKNKPFPLYDKREGEQRGDYWFIPAARGRKTLHVRSDVNFWKTFARRRLRTPMGDPGALSVFGREAPAHALLFDHWCAEYSEKITGPQYGSVHEWTCRPGAENHWWDCLVGCSIGASLEGLQRPGAGPGKKARTSGGWRVATAAEMQAMGGLRGGRG